MQVKIAFVLLLVVASQYSQAEAAWLGRRSGRKLFQANRIGDGAGNVLAALGAGQQGASLAKIGDDVDGDLTNDLAAAGQETGQLMLDTLPTAGSAVPGRKLQQNAGTGAGCNAIFTDFDTASGTGIENAENNIAGDINGAKPAAGGKRRLHQNAGTGAGCDAIFTDFDTASGVGIENAENNIAGDINSLKLGKR